MSVLDHLRHHTRTLHAALEHDLDIMRRLAAPAARLALMRHLYAAYEPAEQALSVMLDPIPLLEFVQRRKTPVLLRDLESLGVRPCDTRSLMRPSPPAIRGTSHALGFAYVLEGASLGGHVIKKRLHAAGLPLAGTEFFGCYGESTAQRWRQFCAVLETECSDINAAVAGARQAFDYMHDALVMPEQSSLSMRHSLDSDPIHV